jgi:hypothetical protein
MACKSGKSATHLRLAHILVGEPTPTSPGYAPMIGFATLARARRHLHRQLHD